MEKIFIIIVNYNGLDDTCECIESIRCSENSNVRIVVVDNDSKVDEGKIIETKYKDVTVLKSKINLGFSGGNNLGIHYALDNGADYLLLLNNDTVIDKRFITVLFENRDMQSVLTGSMYYYSFPDEVAFASGYINTKTGNTVIYNEMVTDSSNTFITGACMFMHRSVIENVGYLDEDYFMYCEDTDYCIRLLKSGYSLKTIEQAKYWHKIGKSSRSDKTFSNYYVTRNRLLCINKNKAFFRPSAFLYTILTRLLRAIQVLPKDIKLSKSFILGIRDGVVGKTGKSSRTY